MNGRAVWLWVLGGVLVVVAVAAGWWATRSTTVSMHDEGTTAGVGPAALAPAVAGTTEPPADAVSTPGEPPPITVVAGGAEAAAPSGGPGPEEGTIAVRPKQVAIRDLFDHRNRYDKTVVIVQGRIMTQCVRGCQFNLDDGTGMLFVELVDEALERVLPRGSIGRRVEVQGVFHATPRPALRVDDPDGVVWR